MPLPFVDRASSALPVQIVSQPKWKAWLREQTAARRAWLESSGVAGNAGDISVFPGREGKAAGAVLVLPAKPSLWDFGALATRLPAGTWKIADKIEHVSPTDAAVAIGLGTWRFDRYKAKKGKPGAKLLWPPGADKARATAIVEAVSLARDLITTPSSDMGPAELAAAVQTVGKAHKA
jgi:leucyl aminopeptidase